MSSATPFFVYCPIKPISRPSSAYAELESPPPSPLQRSIFDTDSDHPRDYKQQQFSNHDRRFNESRQIQIPMDLLHKSRSPGTSPMKRLLSFTTAVSAGPPLPSNKTHTLLNASLVDKLTDSPSPVARPLSPSKRISSLVYRKQQQPSSSTSSVSIHPAGHHSGPVNTRLGDFSGFEEVSILSRPATPTPLTAITTTTTTSSVAVATAISHAALQNTANTLVDDMDVDMNHADLSPPLSVRTPVAVGHVSRHQTPDRVAAMTINNNLGNFNLTNSSPNHTSTSTSIITTPSRVLAPPRHTATTACQGQEPSTPKRKKTLLKSISSSMRQVKKRATDLIGGIRQRRKNSKNFKLDQDEFNEGSLVTKVEDRHLDDEDYDLSTLSLASIVAPSGVVSSSTVSPSRVNSSSAPPSASWLMEVDMISISSDSSKSTDNTAPPLTAAVAADLLQLSWSSPSGPSLFTRSAEDLTRNPMSSFYDFSNCDPFLPDVGLSLAAKTEADRPHQGRRRTKSETAAPVMTLKKSASLSSIARHLRLHYDLKDLDTNEEGAKQKGKQTTKSIRFGGLGSSDWIGSKNHIVPKFMTRYKKGGKKDKNKGYPETNGFTVGGAGGNRSDPFRDPDVDECVELIFPDMPAPKSSLSAPKKFLKLIQGWP
ncbi:hypothetical protein EC957_008779 [Mortierella hygrophila]|uniref:Uncharacterized protein n=1 Tax=Mortierella hygrophila TaxID=979708 RepID=A0A9P6JXH1_9FUNG|nr:hypothetical protein EC957_008779 [Mortierella hygrophila]